MLEANEDMFGFSFIEVGHVAAASSVPTVSILINLSQHYAHLILFWVLKPLEGEMKGLLLGRSLKNKVGVVVGDMENDAEG
mmetsp:Transcript_33318/g.33562  ORF Transcript_33318/g.33562 Transcript_33318/m.33562 type:complete len:81 (+) Transcript_33318:880-1122(+)